MILKLREFISKFDLGFFLTYRESLFPDRFHSPKPIVTNIKPHPPKEDNATQNVKEDAKGLFVSIRQFLIELFDFRDDTDHEATINAIIDKKIIKYFDNLK